MWPTSTSNIPGLHTSTHNNLVYIETRTHLHEAATDTSKQHMHTLYACKHANTNTPNYTPCDIYLAKGVMIINQ